VGAIVIGAASSVLCFYALRAKARLGYDDSLDCFGVHGVGSGLGVLLLSFFIRPSWLDAASAAAGHTWTAINQLGVQLVGLAATVGLAVAGTLVICYVVQKTVGFRLDEKGEAAGLDYSLHGEHGYAFVHPDI